VNIGSVKYKGVEGSIAVNPVKGLTVFANGSYNDARSGTTGAQISKAPFSTAAAGLIYSSKGLRVSFSQKYTGTQYANELALGTDGTRLYRLSPYSTGEFAISQELGKNLRLGATVSNVFNSRAITSISTSGTTLLNGATAYSGKDQFSFLPPRQLMLDVRYKF